MKIVFMGTPDIAADTLQEILAQNLDVVAIFTREDKPVGRKRLLTFPPVKKLAVEKGIAVFQPKNFRSEEAVQALADLAPDLIVVVAYGRILPPEVLQIPKYGCINLHVSMLPKYRGAAPVQWAVINGEEKTGVTIMQLDEGLDTGPILAQQPIDILPDETAGDVFEKVGAVGAKLLCKTIMDIQDGKIQPKPQKGEHSLAPPLNKEMALLAFPRTAGELHNLVRGCNPWPLAWFWQDGKKIKVLETTVVEISGTAGDILQTSPFVVACGENSIQLVRVVPEGSKEMGGTAWAMGRRFKVGDSLL